MRFQSAAVIAVALLNSGAVGVTLTDLHKEKVEQRKLIRKENGASEDEGNAKSLQEVKFWKFVPGHDHGDALNAPNAAWPIQKLSSHYCDDVFPIGRMNTSTCRESNATWENILSEGMCKEAASENGVQELQSIAIAQEVYDLRPRGCFKAPCTTEDKVGTCYYYNPKGDIPQNPDGEPVCAEFKYTRGTAVGSSDTPATPGVHCVTGYEPINDEELCDRASQCLGRCEGQHFVMAINNISAYHDYPLGCFIHQGVVSGTGTNCVFFNPRRNFSAAPKFPQGSPICHITSRADEAHLSIAREANYLCTLDATEASKYDVSLCATGANGIKPADCKLSCASGYSHLEGADPKVRCYKDGDTFTISNPCTASR